MAKTVSRMRSLFARLSRLRETVNASHRLIRYDSDLTHEWDPDRQQYVEGNPPPARKPSAPYD